jgi:hypothetical protein
MSANKSQKFTTSIITSNTTPQTNSEFKSLNNEVDDKVPQDEEEDLSDLANGGWEDDFTDDEDDDDAERMKEWETLEFLCQISKTRSNENDDNKDENDKVENRISDLDSKDDLSIDDSTKDDDKNSDDDFNGIVIEKNKKEKNVKDNENGGIKSDKLASSQPLSHENRKRKALENEDEINGSTLFQKTKKSRDDGLKTLENPSDS